jgi:UDP-2-acetamido-3-amino-2,3-dideoxy-glucuronate N-acetyltransferase
VLRELGALCVVCDASPDVRSWLAAQWPDVPFVDTPEALVHSQLDAVVIASPAVTHFDMARRFLDRGLHVFVEKPLAMTVQEGQQLVQQARNLGKVLQVGHILEYHPARSVIETLLAEERLGELLSARMIRTNLGTIRGEEDVIYSFAPHDIAYALFLGQGMPHAVTAVGADLFHRGLVDSAVLTLQFPAGERSMGFWVQICVSWMEPRKEHRSLLVGSRGMLEWVDSGTDRRLILTDTETTRTPGGLPAVRARSSEDLPIPAGEPLKAELQDFLHCMVTSSHPKADGPSGLRVLRVLDAASRSLANGTTVELT